MKLKAVLFDLDDTLLWDERSVKEAFQATCEAAKQYYPLSAEELEAAVREEARALYETYDFYPFTCNIGINPFEGLWGNFNDEKPEEFVRMKETVPSYRSDAWTRGLRKIGIDDAALGKQLGERFPAERRARSFVYPDTYSVLDALKGNYKLLLLTNGSPDLQQEKLNAEPKLKQYFDHIVISGDFGAGKPAKALFEHVMNLLDIDASEGMMVGDKLTTDIKGANGVGMPSVWINHHKTEAVEANPTYEIAALGELLEVIEKHNR